MTVGGGIRVKLSVASAGASLGHSHQARMSERRRSGGGSPTFDISDDERTGPRQTGGLGEAHRPKSDHPPEFDQARHDHKKAEKELKRKTEQLADAQREQQRREKQSRGGAAASSAPMDEELVGELRESAEGGREQLARERQELMTVELAISEMRGRLAHFARENAEFERERQRQHEQAVEELMVEQRRLRAKIKHLGGGAGVGGGYGGRPLALPAPAAVTAAAATASGPPAVDASGWLALVINLQRRADRLASVRAS